MQIEFCRYFYFRRCGDDMLKTLSIGIYQWERDSAEIQVIEILPILSGFKS
ncbi:MAG: hypothetical protein NT178_17765 [Proteobacteria bacterium]|nr:hypothetical protein [Pseudomonadota bacterium]